MIGFIEAKELLILFSLTLDHPLHLCVLLSQFSLNLPHCVLKLNCVSVVCAV